MEVTASALCGAEGQYLTTTFRDQHGVLPLCGQGVVLGDHGPAVCQQPHVPLAGIHHWFNGERHPRQQLHAAPAFTIVKDLGILVEDAAYTVPAILSHYA